MHAIIKFKHTIEPPSSPEVSSIKFFLFGSPRGKSLPINSSNLRQSAQCSAAVTSVTTHNSQPLRFAANTRNIFSNMSTVLKYSHNGFA